MPRFFMEADLNVETTVELTETVFHHWVKVLRAQVGETATLFNGQGGEYEVTLTEVAKKSASVSVNGFNPDNRTPPFKAFIGQVMSKGDRMDYAIQKSTELGAHTFQLLTSERCEMRLKYDRDQKKIDHWQGIAIAACEQCGLNQVPQIIAPLNLEDWLKQCDANLKFVMALTDGKVNFPSPLPENIAILIGPEGGLSQKEIELAHQYGFISWTIGERVLRTETAPVVALSILNTLHT